MGDFHLLLTHLITSVLWIDCKKFLMRDPCVIFFGLTLMIEAVGEFLLEEQDTHLVRTYLKHSISTTA